MLIHTLAEIQALSQQLDFGIQLYGRVKSANSISAKMSQRGLRAHQVLDIIGIRAVIQHTNDCYRLIDRIHSLFGVLENEYNDYIAVPKPNGYRSLHTTVVSPCRYPVEIQVRTHWMHELCERGAAAHSLYKRDRVTWVPLSYVAVIPGGGA